MPPKNIPHNMLEIVHTCNIYYWMSAWGLMASYKTRQIMGRQYNDPNNSCAHNECWCLFQVLCSQQIETNKLGFLIHA